MIYLFLDESGDLGFDFTKRKTSRYFIIGCLVVEGDKNKKSVEKIVKKVFAGFSKKEIKNHISGLHAFKEAEHTKIKLLTLLASKDAKIITAIINKNKMGNYFANNPHEIYNNLAELLIKKAFVESIISPIKKVELVASRRETSKHLNENFKSCLSKSKKINITIKIPQQEKCLQIADMISWAIYKAYEHGDLKYKNLIENKIYLQILSP